MQVTRTGVFLLVGIRRLQSIRDKGEHMKISILVVLFGTSMLWGCVTDPSGMKPGQTASQQEAAKAALDYRRLAADLREMAHRREVEAEVMARQSNPDQAQIAHWRDMVQQLQTEADAAEQHAREMQKSVPHGMMQ
jgi:hypothetical protein